MRTVLIVAYYFPPLAGGGVYRPLKFAKYLTHYGWKSIVLTVKNAPYHWASDDSLLDELPEEVTVIRSASFEPHRVYTALSLCRLDTLTAWIDRTLFVPDNKIGWIPTAVFRGYQLIRSHNVDAIITTSPPHSSHYIGYALKKWTGRPWIADFRDHWTLNPMGKPRYPDLEHRWEKMILNGCDRVISVTDGNRRELLDAFPLDPRKVLVIPNGYDSADFERLPSPPQARGHKLTIVYSGTFYGTRSPEPFFRALRSLLDREPAWSDKIRVQCVGKAEDHFLDLIRTLRLQGMVRFLGFLPHREALQRVVTADVLLLVIAPEAGNRHVMTGKVFEYLATGKPILALIPDGAAATLLTRARVGIIVDPTDVDAIATQLHALYRRYQDKSLDPDPDWNVIQQFNRRRLTGALSKLLDDVVAGA